MCTHYPLLLTIAYIYAIILGGVASYVAGLMYSPFTGRKKMRTLYEMINLLDAAVFLDDILKVYISSHSPENGKSHASFATAQGGETFYRVNLGGLDAYCREVCSCRQPLVTGMFNVPYSMDNAMTA